MRYSQSFQIAAPIEAVWAVLSDVENYPDWGPTFERIDFPGEKTLAKGLRAKLWVKGAPAAKWIVTQYSEGSQFAWESNVRGVHSFANHVIEPSSGGTKLTLSIEYSGFMSKLFAPMLGKISDRNLGLEGNGLKACVEEPVII